MRSLCVPPNNAFYQKKESYEPFRGSCFCFMKKLNSLEYLKLSKPQALIYDVKMFFCGIPAWFKNALLSLLNMLKGVVFAIRDEFVDIFHTFTKGNWAVKLSFLIFGFGNLYYGQIMRGVLFLLFELIFIVYMFIPSVQISLVPVCIGSVRATGLRSVPLSVQSRAIWDMMISSTLPCGWRVTTL